MDEKTPEFPKSYFEGDGPQSELDPGNTGRELLHEVKNLETSIELMRNMFLKLLPALEILDSLEQRLEAHLEAHSRAPGPS